MDKPKSTKPKYTRLPKTAELIQIGVPREVLPTYWTLADHASNKTGRCWPQMGTLAQILGVSIRTIQRHIEILEELGVLLRERRRRSRGRFSSWLFVLVFFGRITSGHPPASGKKRPIEKRTRRGYNAPPNPPHQIEDRPPGYYREGYDWFFKER